MSSAADQAEDATAQKLVSNDEVDVNDDQSRLVLESQAAEEEKLMASSQNPDACNVDLSNLRGTKAPKKEAHAAEATAAADKKKENSSPKALAQAQAKAAGNAGASSKDLPDDLSTEEDLENLAELVPGLKTKQDEIFHQTAPHEDRASALSAEPVDGENGDTVNALPPKTPTGTGGIAKRTDVARWSTKQNIPTSEIRNLDSMVVMDSHDDEDSDDDDKAKAEETNAEAVADRKSVV